MVNPMVITIILLCGFNHIEKYESMGKIIQYIIENK